MSGYVGVVDIGSNSIRLVIYNGLSRVPVTIFNEKAMCGLARGMSADGTPQPQRIQFAIDSLRRFKGIFEAFGVEQVSYIATSAIREARNIGDFLHAAEDILGQPIQIVSGQEEARLSSYGVLSSFPDATGLMGDLGGGSLELSIIENGEVHQVTSLLLGHQRLMDQLEQYKGDFGPIKHSIEAGLESVPWLRKKGIKTLYAVGGEWRALAQRYMDVTFYPLPVIDHFCIPAEALMEFINKQVILPKQKKLQSADEAHLLIKLSAYIMKRLMTHAGIQQVMFSAYGLREGVLYQQLSDKERQMDPLLASSRYYSDKLNARPENFTDLRNLLTGFFTSAPPELMRLYEAALLLCDIALYEARHVRSKNAFERLLTLPITGISHQERIWIALAINVRYSGNLKSHYLQEYLTLMEPDFLYEAIKLGLFLRLSQTLSCRKPGILPNFKLLRTETQLILRASASEHYLLGDRVIKYLGKLAKTLNLKPKIETVTVVEKEHILK